jgi:hypothetical protein
MITVNGQKKLATLQREFSSKFEYLFLAFIKLEDHHKSVNVRSLDTNQRIADVRLKFSNTDISLNGRTLVQNMENKFLDELGLACQIAVQDYNGHKLYFPIGSFFNSLSLSKANEWAMQKGCTKITDVKSLSSKTVF